MGEITQEYLKERFDYDPEGFLVWKDHPKLLRHASKVGQRVGNIGSRGYMVVGMDKKQHMVHRLIFLWHHGYLPKQIDHRDRNRLNNKIDNLRDLSQSENRQNSTYHTRKPEKASGHKNIQRVDNKNSTRYSVCVTKNGKRYSKYCYSLEEAIEVRDQLLLDLYGPEAKA